MTLLVGNGANQVPTNAMLGMGAYVGKDRLLPCAHVVTTTAQTAEAGWHYILTGAATTVTLPATPTSGDAVWITWANALTTNVIARNAQTIMGVSEDMTLDASTNGTVQLRFVNSSWRIL